jgi:SAM-dependent methyltransferase
LIQAALDDVNRPVWARDVRHFTHADSWTDVGERTAIRYLADDVRGKRILDVGVGTGRTAWLLRLLSKDYTAIDYTPEMVDACRALQPDVDVRLGDARDLSAFADGSIDFVVFSNNGLDALDHEGRRQALSEFHRVLAPGGFLLFSTLDKDGYAFDAAPWQARQQGREQWAKRLVFFSLRFPQSVPRYGRSYANWRRLRTAREDHGDWAIGHFAAHEFGLLVHFTTPTAQRAELEQLGFAIKAIFTDGGKEINASTAPGGHMFFHVIATKPQSASGR